MNYCILYFFNPYVFPCFFPCAILPPLFLYTLFPILWILSKIGVCYFMSSLTSFPIWQAKMLTAAETSQRLNTCKKKEKSFLMKGLLFLPFPLLHDAYGIVQIEIPKSHFYCGVYVLTLHIKAALTKFYICFCKLLH